MNDQPKSRPGTLLDSALAAAARGWHVFPLRPNDKRPALHGEERCPRTGLCTGGHHGWEQRATCDPDRIRACWAAGDFNVGIACGPSGLVVVDLDQPKPGETTPSEWVDEPGVNNGGDVLEVLAERAGTTSVVETYCVTTGRGGEHQYFTAPAGAVIGNSAGRMGWLIDIRAAGGYVVGAGSAVDGRRYTCWWDHPPVPLPAWIAGQLHRPQRPPVDPAAFRRLYQAVDRRSGYAATALRGELDQVLAARPGGRNHALNTAAFTLGQLTGAGILPRPLVEDALVMAGNAIGLSQHECDSTIRSGLNSGERRPREVRA